jgi:hypothetical protein
LINLRDIIRAALWPSCIIFFASCATSHSAVNQTLIHPAGNSVSPNHCRIRGTIVAIDSTLDSSDSTRPCAKVPCNADVRIDSILGYGSAFGSSVVQGEQYRIHFVFTLAPTSKQLFPSMDEVYPGLSSGSSFIADIERQNSKGTFHVSGATQSMAAVFVIYSYSRLSESPH